MVLQVCIDSAYNQSRQRRTDFSGIVGFRTACQSDEALCRQRRTDFSGIVGRINCFLGGHKHAVNVGRISQVLWGLIRLQHNEALTPVNGGRISQVLWVFDLLTNPLEQTPST